MRLIPRYRSLFSAVCCRSRGPNNYQPQGETEINLSLPFLALDSSSKHRSIAFGDYLAPHEQLPCREPGANPVTNAAHGTGADLALADSSKPTTGHQHASIFLPNYVAIVLIRNVALTSPIGLLPVFGRRIKLTTQRENRSMTADTLSQPSAVRI